MTGTGGFGVRWIRLLALPPPSEIYSENGQSGDQERDDEAALDGVYGIGAATVTDEVEKRNRHRAGKNVHRQRDRELPN